MRELTSEELTWVGSYSPDNLRLAYRRAAMLLEGRRDVLTLQMRLMLGEDD